MKSLRLTAVLLLACGWLSICRAQDPCQDDAVVYESAPEWIAKKIQIFPPKPEEKPPPGGKMVTSPQGTRWFVEIDPDYQSVAQPWNTTLQIGGGSPAVLQLEARFLDHGNSFTAHWINEQLLFVQVWWGHIASSDLIINIDTGKLIYDRLAHYGQKDPLCHGRITPQ